MLRFLQRLLGWSSHPTDSNPEGYERRREPRTSVTSVLATHPMRLAEKTDAEPTTEGVGRKFPELSMNKPGEDGGSAHDAGEANQPDAWVEADESRNG